MEILDSAGDGRATDGDGVSAVVRPDGGSSIATTGSSPDPIPSGRQDAPLVRRPPLLLTSERLSSVLNGAEGAGTVRSLRRSPTTASACGALVHALFRQLVAVGSIDDPMDDGLSALEADEDDRPLCQWIAALPGAERSALAAEVTRQARGLVSRWPRLDPAWLPRTKEGLRTAVTGGAAALSASIDLAIGRPGLDVASVALVGISSGVRHPEHRRALHFAALIETLRHPAPPFAVAAYYTRTGELDVDPVTDEMLTAVSRRAAAGLRLLSTSTGGAGPGGSAVALAPRGPSRGCAWELVDDGRAVDAHRCQTIRGTHGGTHP